MDKTLHPTPVILHQHGIGRILPNLHPGIRGIAVTARRKGNLHGKPVGNRRTEAEFHAPVALGNTGHGQIAVGPVHVVVIADHLRLVVGAHHEGGRLQLTLENGERLGVSRQYAPAIKEKLGIIEKGRKEL